MNQLTQGQFRLNVMYIIEHGRGITGCMTYLNFLLEYVDTFDYDTMVAVGRLLKECGMINLLYETDREQYYQTKEELVEAMTGEN